MREYWFSHQTLNNQTNNISPNVKYSSEMFAHTHKDKQAPNRSEVMHTSRNLPKVCYCPQGTMTGLGVTLPLMPELDWSSRWKTVLMRGERQSWSTSRLLLTETGGHITLKVYKHAKTETCKKWNLVRMPRKKTYRATLYLSKHRMSFYNPVMLSHKPECYVLNIRM